MKPITVIGMFDNHFYRFTARGILKSGADLCCREDMGDHIMG
jgi:hypothetical protein